MTATMAIPTEDILGSIKPPLGSSPFHKVQYHCSFCCLCGMSQAEITNTNKVFCLTIFNANVAAGAAWREVMAEGIAACHVTGLLENVTLGPGYRVDLAPQWPDDANVTLQPQPKTDGP